MAIAVLRKGLVFGIATILVLGAECATTRYWVGGDGNWSDTAHWKGGNKPAYGESVQFPASLESLTVTMDEDSADLQSFSLEGQAGEVGGGSVMIAGTHRFGQGESMTSDCTVDNGRKLIVNGA